MPYLSVLGQKRCGAQHKETNVSKKEVKTFTEKQTYNFVRDFIRPQFQHLFLEEKKPPDAVMSFVFFAEKLRWTQQNGTSSLRDGAPLCGHLGALTRTHTIYAMGGV